ncbi:SMP-30/gluconolactonase/LRE family protein [Paenibacillus agricola]|uniref:SMP-30/gluconolactonase/LRE family protein n=1 Tax=Paenibacillus agricola TaxID=2716264 RepID=UPI001FB5E564|nr:SMP-30/gluconolactonase/LRE family protein [Paenibacillus agricola]
MNDLHVELVLDAHAALGEGPCWDHGSGLLYWVNIVDKQIRVFNPQTVEDRTIQLDQMVGAVVPRQSGGLVAALQHGFYLLDLETEQLTLISDPEDHLPDNRFNDGKCDPVGRFWAGTTSTQEVDTIGSLYCLGSDHSVRKMVDGVIVSNGLAWSPDGRTMYYIDSPTKRVVAYDFDMETGALSQLRTIITIAEDGGYPDGMTIDAEGMLWVAQWGGWQVSRWNPHTGELLATIPVPVAQVSSCTFGGANLDELYITTASVRQTAEFLAKQPHAGGLFRVKPGVTGLQTHFFGG